MSAQPPGLEPGKRWRCDACGNLTRFDVETTERVRRFWHLDLAGQGAAEEEEFVQVEVVSLACRWCGSRDAVRVDDVPGSGTPEPS